MSGVLLSLKNAFVGLLYCFRTQRNMFIHAMVGSIVIFAAILLQVNVIEMLFLISAIFSVLVAETINTAIEKTIDLYTKKRNHLAQTAKDVAAGAVLLTAIFSLIVGSIVLGPPLWHFAKLFLLLP